MRLRFANQIWDMTLLEPGTEIGFDLTKVYTRNIDYRNGETPVQEVIWYLISGTAGVKTDNREYGNLPAPAFIRWDNKGPGRAILGPSRPAVCRCSRPSGTRRRRPERRSRRRIAFN